MRVRIGTRGSTLALWQANEAARLFAAAGYETGIVTVRTTGDKRADVSLASIGGKGLFIKELEEALDRDEIDVAVHSLKDVPSIIPEHFALAAFLERADPRDAWVQIEGTPIEAMPSGAVIGTSAPRRRAQLLGKYPHLVIEDIRGNVDTRIRKARDGKYAGIVLAAAGLTRLGRANEITSYFSVDEMIPAAGQGIIAIECLASNADAFEAARAINHEASEIAALNERGLLQKFGTRLDCYSAVAAHCTVIPLSPPSGERAGVRSAGQGLNDPLTLTLSPVGEEGTEITIRAFVDGVYAQGPNVDVVYEELTQ